MPNYCRWFVAGGCFFFTVVVHQRRRLFDDPRAVALLGNIMRECNGRWPYTVNAMVLLPDHLHVIWTLPASDAEYSKRLGWIKKEFTKRWEIGRAMPDELRAKRQAQPDLRISAARQRERRHGIWQPRFWEHTLDSDDDFERHFDYIHWNPVKHGYVQYPHEWEHSTFHRYVDRGVYDRRWGCFTAPPPASFRFEDIKHTTGE
jgi:putative transposase